MNTLQITYRGLEKVDTYDQMIRERALALHQYYDKLIGCRVAIEKKHKQAELGSGYRVRIDLTFPPQQELVVALKSDKGENLDRVIGEAFDRAERQLQKTVDKIRGEVKTHPAPGAIHAEEPEFAEEVRGR